MKFTKFVDGKSGNAIMNMRVSERNTNIYSKIKTVALRYLKREETVCQRGRWILPPRFRIMKGVHT